MTDAIQILPVAGLPEIERGADLAAVIAAQFELRDGDVVVVSQKVVSKAEGALVPVPRGEDPAVARRRIAREQAVDVVADAPWALIVRTRHGFVCANAGIDASNVPGGALTLLPEDPDRSAAQLRRSLARHADVAVIVSDTFGRPWRQGQTDVAIGVAGMAALRDERGGRDRHGTVLEVTEVAVADQVAAAADLVRTKTSGVPVVVVRGLTWEPAESARATDLVRGAETDLFPRGRGMLADALAAAWPQDWAQGISDEDLQVVRRVAPQAQLVTGGPPAVIRAGDDLRTGLAAAVLADLGLAVRFQGAPGELLLESGRPAASG